ncbi:hypothetical protein V495_07667 [Pseudogymnoascus sp. VKM F-4514 (FW-929)]|nr:hypothetical protein V495_07667 [Pseudogymnoascus sp. VKM F-4514 (FW-929)]KFY55360.1 hypothetical protein V497_07034 [Pseudogymnoascus sp. VKM F-4516 (FW-969)]
MINASNPGIDEKMQVINQKAVSASETDTGPTTSPTLSDSDLDDAFKYLHDHDNAFAESTNINLAALRRKIDWRIMPIMFVCYVLQFVDKVVINYAAVMGINKDLALTKNNFSNVGSAFFIAYLIAEVPTGYVLQKIPPGKWLGINVCLWGISCAAAAGATDYHSLLATRIFLGMFEAAIAPCLMLISSQYYTKSEQAPRFSIWYCGLGFGQIIGGLLSFAFQHVTNQRFKSWQAMFVFVGVTTSLIGIATFFILPDTPMKAKWLSEPEKAALLKHVSINQTGIKNKHFKMAQAVEVLGDIQLWLMTICTICTSVSSGVITTYSATLIQSFGFTPQRTALLNMPSGLVSIASSLIVGFGVRKSENRWAWLALCCVPGMIGGGLMSFMPAHNRAALLAGIYLVNGITGTLTVIYQWTMANVAGHTKRSIAAALIAGSFSVGNIIGPQTFQAKDSPGYRPAKIAVMATQAGAAVMAIVLCQYYLWANKRKDKHQAVKDGLASSVGDEKILWENLTDKENPNFRYVY